MCSRQGLSVGAFVCTVFFLAITMAGCGSTPPERSVIAELYGAHNEDREFCMNLMRAYKPGTERRLAAAEIEKLKSLQTVANPVSFDATAALAGYANEDPALQALLTSRIEELFAINDVDVQRAAVSIAKWYKVRSHASAFERRAASLRSSQEKSVTESLLLDEIESYVEHVILAS